MESSLKPVLHVLFIIPRSINRRRMRFKKKYIAYYSYDDDNNNNIYYNTILSLVDE